MENFKFEKKTKRSLGQMAYESIRNAILNGDLKPGDRVIESSISEQMGISRVPIREALIRLEHEGLVFSHPYRETVVADINTTEVEQVLVPIRRTIETYAALKASEILTDEDFKELSLTISKMEIASSKDDLQMIAENDMYFHNLLISKCVTPSLLNIWSNISGRIFSRFLYQGILHESFEDVVKEHTDYLNYIKEGNPEKIKNHLMNHIY